MNRFPVLATGRLVLRKFQLSDAPEVKRLVGDREVAANTLLIPHPYENGMAETWISTNSQLYDRGEGVIWAITCKKNKVLMGAIGLNIEPAFQKAELGYWVGRQYWSNNYATEAGFKVVEYGFKVLKLNRIYSRHLGRNPASGRVMQKLGMKHEGCLRQDVIKWGKLENIEIYGLLRSEYLSDVVTRPPKLPPF